MEVKIRNIDQVEIKGVQVHMAVNDRPSENRYFVWKESPLTAKFQSKDVSGGVLKSWHHEPVFSEVEYHCDQEMFYFVAGTAIMLFADIEDGTVNMNTVQAVRIPCGTQLIIEKGKGHFVAIAENDEPVEMVVVAPKMDAPKIPLGEVVRAV